MTQKNTHGYETIQRPDKLKPCPFCGGIRINLMGHKVEEEMKYTIECSDCGTRSRDCNSHNEAVSVWNSRPATIRTSDKLRNLLTEHSKHLRIYAEQIHGTESPALKTNLLIMAHQLDMAIKEYLSGDEQV